MYFPYILQITLSLFAIYGHIQYLYLFMKRKVNIVYEELQVLTLEQH